MDIKPYLNKAARYCARYETCTHDLRQKLYKWQVPEQFHTQIIDYLTDQGFIDDQRYAQSFVHDKFYLNGWGKRKIEYHLRQKNIPSDIISLALEEIDIEEYKNTLRKLLIRKKDTIKTTDPFALKQKLITFAANRGFEPDIIYTIVDELLKS